MARKNQPIKIWITLTIPIALLVIVAAAGGLFNERVYESSSLFVAQITAGTDLVTLVVALPSFIASAILALRGSYPARLIWFGVLFYFAYTYMMNAFMVNFNLMFLIYVAILGLSTVALAGGVSAADLVEVKTLFSEKAPAKTISAFLYSVVIIFYPVWLYEIISAQVSGDLPRMIRWAETPTHAYYVLDLALLFPALGFTASWLRKRKTVGLIFGGAALVFLLIEILTIISGMIFTAQRSNLYPIFPEIIIYIIGSVFTFVMLILYFGKIADLR